LVNFSVVPLRVTIKSVPEIVMPSREEMPTSGDTFAGSSAITLVVDSTFDAWAKTPSVAAPRAQRERTIVFMQPVRRRPARWPCFDFSKKSYIQPSTVLRSAPSPAMTESPANSDPSPPEADDALRAELAELVRRSLLEIGQMSETQDRIKEIAARLSKCTPRPDPPEEPGPN
jgi:hypothetical protein